MHEFRVYCGDWVCVLTSGYIDLSALYNTVMYSRVQSLGLSMVTVRKERVIQRNQRKRGPAEIKEHLLPPTYTRRSRQRSSLDSVLPWKGLKFSQDGQWTLVFDGGGCIGLRDAIGS